MIFLLTLYCALACSVSLTIGVVMVIDAMFCLWKRYCTNPSSSTNNATLDYTAFYRGSNQCLTTVVMQTSPVESAASTPRK